MSKYSTHMIVGFVFILILYILVRFYSIFDWRDVQFLLFLPIIMYYTLLPDIDTKHSVVRRISFLVALIVFAIFFVMILVLNDKRFIAYMIVLFLFLILVSYLQHRTITHTIIAGLLFALPLILLDFWLAVFCFVAYLTHLFLDGELKLW